MVSNEASERSSGRSRKADSRRAANFFSAALRARAETCRLACTGQSCDLTLQQSCFEAGDAGGFSRAVDIGDGGLLLFVDFDEIAAKITAEQRRELGVGHEVKAACEQIAGLVPGFGSVGELDTFEQACGFVRKSGDWPAASAVWSFAKSSAVADALPDLGGMRPERGGEGRKLRYATPAPRRW